MQEYRTDNAIRTNDFHYTLGGTLNHHGATADEGHYTAHIKNIKTNRYVIITVTIAH